MMLEEFNSFSRLLKIKWFFKDKNNTNNYNPRYKVKSIWEPKDIPYKFDTILLKNKEKFNLELNQSLTTKPKYNLKKSEKDTLKNIISDQSIKICNSDKNLGITLVDTIWYKNEIENQLKATSSYSPKIPNTIKIGKELHTTVQKYLHILNKQEQKFLLHKIKVFKSPQFYIIPKIHKIPVKGRPIVPSHSWITTPPSIWLDTNLRPIMKYCPNVCHDSREIVNMIEENTFPKNCIFVTGDINSLYTNIPTDSGIRKVSTLIRKYIDEKDKQDCIIELLQFVLNNNYFLYEGNWYHQISGTAMGTPTAPVFANIFLQFLENTCQNKRLASKKTWPRIYKRYIDDILIIWEDNEESLSDFLIDLNQMEPNIKINWKDRKSVV